MAFNIETDLTISGTKLNKDGKDMTKNSRVVSISFYASSPVKDSEYDHGYIDLSVTSVDDEGKITRTSYCSKDEYMAKRTGLGKKEMKDLLEEVGVDSVVRFIGHDADEELKNVAEAIVKHCEDKELSCPNLDTLLSRSLDSLKDKAEDLGITFEDDADTNDEEEDGTD